MGTRVPAGLGHWGPLVLACDLGRRATNISGYISRADGLRGVFYSKEGKKRGFVFLLEKPFQAETGWGSVMSEWAEEVEGSKSIPKMLPAVWNCIMAVPEVQRTLRQDPGWSEPVCWRLGLFMSQSSETLTNLPS